MGRTIGGCEHVVPDALPFPDGLKHLDGLPAHRHLAFLAALRGRLDAFVDLVVHVDLAVREIDGAPRAARG